LPVLPAMNSLAAKHSGTVPGWDSPF
jgi:hypothetical protein